MCTSNVSYSVSLREKPWLATLNGVRQVNNWQEQHFVRASVSVYSSDTPLLEKAFDNARSKAGNVSELFDILKGTFRPERRPNRESLGKGGQASSGHSILQAHYYGSTSNTVLSTANLQRIQAFLDEPQRQLGQVRVCGNTPETVGVIIYGRPVSGHHRLKPGQRGMSHRNRIEGWFECFSQNRSDIDTMVGLTPFNSFIVK